MRRTALALTLISALLFSMVAGTLFSNVGRANPYFWSENRPPPADTKPPTIMMQSPENKIYSAPFASLDAPTVSLDASDNSVETSNPALSPTELWNFTAINITAYTTGSYLSGPEVANGIAYLCNTEYYIIPGEPPLYPFNFTPQHTLQTFYALNISSGDKLWNFTTHASYRSDNPFTIVAGVTYICADGNLYALDAVTGAQKWVYNIDGHIFWCSIIDGVVYVAVTVSNNFCYVCALNAANGRELWKWYVGQRVGASYPAIGDGVIYFGTINHYYAVSSRNGTKLWNVAIYGSVSGSSTLVDGIVYFFAGNTTSEPSSNPKTYVYSLNAQNGDKLWNYPVGYIAYSSPIVDDGIVYVAGRDAYIENPHSFSRHFYWGTSNVFALNATDGNKVWNYSANDTALVYLGLIDDVAYFSSNDTFYASNAANGAQLWSQNTGGYGSYTINDGVLYYYSVETLYALDTSNGNSLWNYTTASNRSFLTVANGVAFFRVGNTVYALSVPAVVHPSSMDTESFPIVPVATVSLVSVIAIGIGLVVYFKKRKH